MYSIHRPLQRSDVAYQLRKDYNIGRWPRIMEELTATKSGSNTLVAKNVTSLPVSRNTTEWKSLSNPANDMYKRFTAYEHKTLNRIQIKMHISEN